MSARYRVQCADALMAWYPDGMTLPEGFRPVSRGKPVYAVPPYDGPGDPQTSVVVAHWWLFEDDNAPPELDGKRVALLLSQEWADGKRKTTVLTREVVGE